MEGPSLYLAAEQLRPFIAKRIKAVSGNTAIGKERLDNLIVRDIFSWGKHLVLQFDDFALRVHFMLFGTFEARVGKTWVTGDYRKAREPRLALSFSNGEINMYNCSIKFIENSAAKNEYDYSIDIMSSQWDPDKAYRQVRKQPDEEIADVLLDQTIFAGVGNIIKNEILAIAHISPLERVQNIPPKTLKELIVQARAFSKQFLAWRREFVLRKHLRAHQKGTCPQCGGKMIRQKTGKRQRWSYWCTICQPFRQSSFQTS